MILSMLHAVYNMVNHQKIKTTMSSKGLNRVSIVNGYISQVFGADHVFKVESDDENGQIFLRAVRETDIPITITIITDKGFTQDIEIQLSDIESKTVLLRLPEEKCTDNSHPHDMRDQICTMIKNILENKTAAYSPLKDQVGFSYQRCSVRFLKGYESLDFELCVYEIQNTHSRILYLTEKAIAESVARTEAIYIKDKYLTSKQYTTILLVKRKG